MWLLIVVISLILILFVSLLKSKQTYTDNFDDKNKKSINDELNLYEKDLESKKEFSSLTVYRRGATFFKSDTNDPYYFFFDCETTGIPGSGKVIRIVQLSWLILDKNFCEVKNESFYLNPGKPIPEDSIAIHHITNEIVNKKSTPHIDVLKKFYEDLERCTWIVAHNFDFDAGRVDLETKKVKLVKPSLFEHKKSICTMEKGTNYCKLEPKIYGSYKWPTLEELASYCGFRAEGLHDALNDVYVTAKCFEIMVRENYIKRKGINL